MPSILTRSLVPAAAALLMLLGAGHAGDVHAQKVRDTPIGMPHDFDAQHGVWHTTVRRLLKPLSNSNEWAEYEGPGIVHPLLGGAANVAELDVSGPKGRIQGISVRLFDPKAQRWTIRFASASTGALDDGISGGFAGGRRGVFYGADTWNGRPIVVRFIINVVDANTVQFEQAFSANDGVDWEVNWVATDKRK
jgi:hypothetical protein